MLSFLATSPDEHLRWVSAQAQATKPLYPRAALLWFRECEAYAEDTRLALAWALETARYEEGLRLAVTLARYWWVLGECHKGRAWLGAFLEGASDAPADLRKHARLWLVALSGWNEPALTHRDQRSQLHLGSDLLE
jgi:hypothetical protein